MIRFEDVSFTYKRGEVRKDKIKKNQKINKTDLTSDSVNEKCKSALESDTGFNMEEYGVINCFSYEFLTGSIVAVTGSNGCGKTTLMKLATGVLRPDEGRILIDEDDEAEMDVFQIGQRIGCVYQDPTRQLFCETVYEEVAYGLRNMGLEEAEVKRRVEYYLDFFRLGDMREVYPGQMSQGEKQRVMLACVMAMGTRYIVLDEPTSGLDMKGREALGQMLLDLKAQSRGIIIVSHERSFIDKYADVELKFDEVKEPEKMHKMSSHETMVKQDIEPEVGTHNVCNFESSTGAGQKVSENTKSGKSRKQVNRQNHAGFLASLDPRTKLLILAVISTASVLSQNVFRLVGILAVLMVFLVAGGVPIGDAVGKVRTVLKLIGSLFVLQCLFARGGETLFEIGGFSVLTYDGVHMAFVVCLRLLILTCSALLLLTGESRDYLLALTQMHVPYEIAFMVMVALKFIPLLGSEASDVIAAVQMRGTKIGGTGLVNRARVYLSVSIPIVAGAIRRAEQMNIAMESRAFRVYPRRTSMRRVSMKGCDWIVSAAAVVMIVGLCVLV